MAFNVMDDPEQRAGFIMSLVFTPVCILATALRFVATRRHNRKYGWDDWHALAALVTFLPYMGYTLWVFSKVNGRPVLAFIKADPMGAQEAVRVGNIMNGLYGIQQSFVKFSLLALYYRLFWVNKAFTISVWITGVVQGCLGLVILLAHIFACRPMAKVWNPTLPGYCIKENIFFSIYEPLNSLLDFIVAGLAIWMLPALQTRKATQLHLAALFLLGGFSGIIGIIKVVEAQHAAQRNFKSVVWNIVQMATSIICCCAPIYRSILPRLGLYEQIYTWATSTFGGTKKSENQSAGAGASSAKFSSRHAASSKSSGFKERSQWVNLDGSSQKGLAWVETDEEHGRYQDDNIPMGQVRVHKSVDVV